MSVVLKETPIECCFSYFWNDKCSLVVDILRYHGRIISRIFLSYEGKPYDYTRYCQFPTGSQPFEAKDKDYLAVMDLEKKNINGKLEGHDKDTGLVFDIDYNDPQQRFSVSDPYERLSKDLFMLKHRPSLLNRLAHFAIPTIDATQFKDMFSLYHEDFPVVEVPKASVKFSDEPPQTKGFRGAIAHHWGWAFPDYIFLMCNNFSGCTDTSLSLSLTRNYIPIGIELVTGYLYLRHKGKEKELSVNNLSTTMYYFMGKPGSSKQDKPHDLIILAWPPKNPNQKIRLKIEYDRAKYFPHIMGTRCWTYLDVDVTVECDGNTLRGYRAVLDVKGKGFKLI
jgi:hypothetical protein